MNIRNKPPGHIDMLSKKAYFFIKNKLVAAYCRRRTLKFVPEKVKNYRDYFSLQSRKVDGPLVLEFMDGFRLKCDSADLIAALETCILGDYEPNPGFLIHPGQTVLDVGANIGDFAIYAASKGARVFAFEPEPRNIKRMGENIKLNNLEHRIKILPYALSSQSGEVVLNVSSVSPGGHTVGEGDKTIKVPAISLVDFLKQENIRQVDILKIDIEGGEYEVISKCPAEVFDKIEKIVGEYHLSLTNTYNFNTLKRYLNLHYKTVRRYNPYYFYAIK